MMALLGRVSIARFIFVCAAVCGTARRAAAEAAAQGAHASSEPAPYSAWHGSAPYDSPPAIVLRAAPPPELAPLEYARRPFELVPEFALGFPSCSDGSANDTRCQGLGAGVGLGLSALWRVTPYFAFGGTLSASRFAFSPKGSSELRDSSASGVFYGLLGRVYFADHGPIEPYFELALGGGADSTSAREADAMKYSETALGGAVRVGGAVEFYLGRHLRLGPALSWTRLRVSRVERCGGAQACVDLDPGQNGHGVGFTTLSARLTILLGPGL
jgi:hypothetical protein